MIDTDMLDALGDNWMYRNNTDGKGHDGFQWKPIGEWTTCPKWSDATKADCESGGLFGQGPGGYGLSKSGNRFLLCETRGRRMTVGGDKIKVQSARILYEGQDALYALVYLSKGHVGGWLDLRGTGITSLPDGLHVGG